MELFDSRFTKGKDVMRALVPTLAILVLLQAAPARASDPRLFLAWHAPYGAPGATSSLNVSCADSTVRDTLFCTFISGRTDTLYDIDATIYFKAALGDTIGPSWWFGGGMKNRRNIMIEYPGMDGWSGCANPWPSNGLALVNYDRTAGSGRLQISYAIPS